jgi:EAL domain-containing protein (putative c-di-GMP-specific phosphodiesterase class I)
MPVSQVPDAASITFEQLLRDRAVDMALQPIVRIDEDEVVAFEALARGPAGSAWASPDALFAEAYRVGKAVELDWVCRLAAARSFIEAAMPDSITLFVNVEPMAFGSSGPSDLAEPLSQALTGHGRVILEVTERSVAAAPAQMLRAVENARRSSFGVALDDVGVEPASLAMMPLIQPDVIKLDLSLVQQRHTRATARIVNAVLAEAERTGAAILAEGIESDRHLRVAQGMGASLGQGWHFGKPQISPSPPPAAAHPIEFLAAPDGARAPTPFAAVHERRISQGTEQLLALLSRHLEYRGFDAMDPTVLLACFQDADRFVGKTRRRYEQLAARGVFTAVLGRNMPTEPGPGIRGACLEPADPITHEWAVIVLGTQFAGALLAQQHDGDSGVFDFVLTHDSAGVIAAARPVIKRIIASNG